MRVIHILGSYSNLESLAFPSKTWIPAGKRSTKTAIDQLSTDLQEGMCTHR